MRIPEPDPRAQRALRDATFDACGGDFRLLTTRPDLLPPGATYPLVGIAFDRNAPCSPAALDLLVHLLPAYPKAVVWYTGGDRVYDVAAFRACVARSMMS